MFIVIFFVLVSAGLLIYFFFVDDTEENAEVKGIVADKNQDTKEQIADLSTNKSKSSSNKKKTKTRKKLEAMTATTKKDTIADRFERAGLFLDPIQSFVVVGVASLVIGLGVFVALHNFIFALAAGIVGGTIFFFKVLDILAIRRQKLFLREFNNALGSMIRGVRTGLPLSDCIKLISVEADEPVRSEFKYILESEKMGMPFKQALSNLYRRIPLQEVNLFSIVLQIQRQTGGNLAESLENLEDVIRNRRIIRDKIMALSMEARVSAAIIGSLPFFTATLVGLSNPNYLSPLFTTNDGRALLILAGGMMIFGTLVMKMMMKIE